MQLERDIVVEDDEVLRAKPESTQHLSNQERDGLDYALYQDSAKAPDAIGMDPEDGLPRPIPAISMEDSMAPPLTVGRLVCMADTSEYVVRDEYGNVKASYKPEQVTRSVSGSYWAEVKGAPFWVHALVLLLTSALLIAAIVELLDYWWVVGVTLAGTGVILFLQTWLSRRVMHIKVEPKRPQCRHYVRQLIPWHEDKEHNTCQRYCSALKNETGEILSISNQEVLACEIRRPRHLETETLIDDFDAKIISKGQERTDNLDEFDIEAALNDTKAPHGFDIEAALNDIEAPHGRGGIFGDNNK